MASRLNVTQIMTYEPSFYIARHANVKFMIFLALQKINVMHVQAASLPADGPARPGTIEPRLRV